MKEDIRNTYNYIRANEKTILSQKHSLARMDVTVQVTALLGSTQQTGVGSAVFCGIVSAVFGRNLKPALGVIGNISIGGAVERAVNFSDRVSLSVREWCQDRPCSYGQSPGDGHPPSHYPRQDRRTLLQQCTDADTEDDIKER
jgi:hypothetical protein